MESKKTNPKLVSLGVLLAVVLLVVAVSAIDKRNKTAVAQAGVVAAAETNIASKTAAPATTAVTPTTASVYKDGTYSATGSYDTPDGPQSIDVSLTIASDTVTDATVTGEANSGESTRYQDKFISGYKGSVIGKKIATLKLGTISGSSLTPEGFNDVVVAIRTQAKA